jgi:predicted AAA+ superfamily ATPase
MIERIAKKKILELSEKIPVITVTGPRQSGKTTLVKSIFPSYSYVNLEYTDNRRFAADDPRGFLRSFSDGVIIDEVQHVPTLLSYIQGNVDESGLMGRYILTGSQNLLLLQNVSQSLAGRTAILHLLPLSLEELFAKKYKRAAYEDWIVQGFYPRLYDKKLSPQDWIPDYIETYLERDVRNVLNVQDLSLFRTFLRLCAGRIGQILNLSSLGNDIGVDQKTVRKWLSVLEATFTVFILRPYFRNFNKRMIKSPKLYFIDTGIACNLLEIKSPSELSSHYARGALFENLILSELWKNNLNRALQPDIYFWRDSNGHEVDCLAESAGKIRGLEIKSGRTVAKDFFDGLQFLQEAAGVLFDKGEVIYGGDSAQNRSTYKVEPWFNIAKMRME